MDEQKPPVEWFDRMWDPQIHKMNRWASLWWYGLFLIREPNGAYGPRQMVLASTAFRGSGLRMEGKPFQGFQTPFVEGHTTMLNGYTAGWLYQGKEPEGRVLELQAPLQIVQKGGGEGTISCEGAAGWSLFEGGPEGLRWQLEGPRFQVDAQLSCDHSDPVRTMEASDRLESKIWSIARIRQFDFTATVKADGEVLPLEGKGYFQRVLVFLPMFPWYWSYLMFPDGSVLAWTIAYAGAKMVRRAHRLWSPMMENAIVPLVARAQFYDGPTGTFTRLEKAQVRIIRRPEQPECPRVVFEASSANGDHFQGEVDTYFRHGWDMQRPHLGGLFSTSYNFHEYLGRVSALSGRVGGRSLQLEEIGPGFGNLEHTFGFLL